MSFHCRLFSNITVVFPILSYRNVRKPIELTGSAYPKVRWSARVLSDLGVAWAVLSAAWFLGELAKPRSATARSVSLCAPPFASWNWPSLPSVSRPVSFLWNLRIQTQCAPPPATSSSPPHATVRLCHPAPRGRCASGNPSSNRADRDSSYSPFSNCTTNISAEDLVTNKSSDLMMPAGISSSSSRHSLSRWAGQRSLQARRALVSLASIAEWPVNNRCVSAPHDDMRRRRRESHGWRGLARSGRVVGPREGDGSLIDARLVALASINLGGSCHCKWASA